MQQSAKLFLIWLKRLSLLDRSVVRKPKTGEERRINLLSAKTLLLIKLDKLWTNALDINCPVPTGLQSQWKLIFYSMFTSKTQPELLRKSRYKYSTLIGPQCFSGQGHQQMAPAPPTTYVLCSSDTTMTTATAMSPLPILESYWSFFMGKYHRKCVQLTLIRTNGGHFELLWLLCDFFIL